MKILSIDGGGIRGLIPALVLAEFEGVTGQSIAKHFDLIAGTSTGGIIALALAAGIPAGMLVEFYLERGASIFSRSLRRRLESLGGLTDELYDVGELEIALHELFGGRKLSEVETEALAVGYDIEARETILFRSRSAHFSPRDDFLLADVGRATAAAPTYFEPVIVHSMGGTSHACIDGGVVANNPALIAALTCRPFRGDHLEVVSFGTGRRALPVLLSQAKDWGVAGWARPLLDIVFSGQSEIVDEECLQLLGPEHYVRLQPDLPENVAMDATDVEAFALMRQAAKRVIESDAATRALAMLGVAA